MNNATKTLLQKELMSEFQKFFDAAKEAERTVYKSLSGKEHQECPGAYSDEMNRAIAHDMVTAHLALSKTDLDGESLSWMPKMTTLNTEIMRAIDDVNGDRPVKALPKGMFDSLRDSLDRALEDEKAMVTESFVKDLPERIVFWRDRVSYMEAWYFKLRQLHKIRFEEFDAQCREYNAEGTKMLNGLSEEDEKTVKALCDIRKILLSTYVKIPVSNPLSEALRDTLIFLETATEEVLSNKRRDFTEPTEEYEEMAKEKDSDDLAGVLNAIKVTAGIMEGEFTGENRAPETYEELIDVLKAVTVTAKRLKEKLDKEDDRDNVEICENYRKGIAKMLRLAADGFEKIKN